MFSKDLFSINTQYVFPEKCVSTSNWRDINLFRSKYKLLGSFLTFHQTEKEKYRIRNGWKDIEYKCVCWWRDTFPQLVARIIC